MNEYESNKEMRARIRSARQDMNRIQGASDISDAKDLLKLAFWSVVVLFGLFVFLSIVG